ncbi:MAG: SPOR domain-containing protein [Acidobacteriota bacterium]
MPEEPKQGGRPKSWLASGRALVLIAAGVLAFAVSTLVPLLRNEVAPILFTEALVDVEFRVLGDEGGRSYVRHKRDGTIYSLSTLDARIRISSKSEFPISVDNVQLYFQRIDYENSTIEDWESEYVYYGGAEAEYDKLRVELEASDRSPVNLLTRTTRRFPDQDAPGTAIVYKLAPYETEYIFLRLSYEQSEEEPLRAPLGLLLDLRVNYVVKGQTASRKLEVPVNLLVGMQRLPSAPDDERGSDSYLLEDGWIHSSWYETTDKWFRRKECPGECEGFGTVVVRPGALKSSSPALIAAHSAIEESLTAGRTWAVVLGGFSSPNRAKALAAAVRTDTDLQLAIVQRGELYRVIVFDFSNEVVARNAARGAFLDEDASYAVNLTSWCSAYQTGPEFAECRQ